ncbi:MAG: hypothetical protein HUK40_12850 [Desulfobacter sp.]|nr:hypothetical protein [Desulfobacter sp.]WDP83835.1 MAG: hypothetical protein HUN05_00505 [Desulfobacter sp.]
MNISTTNKKILTDEFNFAIDKMESSKNPDEVLYYFTGFYNMIQRIFNIEYCEELVFAYVIMDRAYGDIMGRMNLIKSGQAAVAFEDDFGPELIKKTKNVRDSFFNREKRLKSLQDLIALSYTATGNGHYLLQKKLSLLDFKKEAITDKTN